MSVPTHGPFCSTWTYSTNCWHCKARIHVFHCTCGSCVLFDALGWPWPHHDCRSGKLPTGWAAISKLVEMGIPIDERVIAYAFPDGSPTITEKPPPFVRALPTNGTKLQFIGIVREIQITTKRNRELAQLGQAGWKMIGLSGAMHFWQITVADNSKSPQQTYTGLVPDDFDQHKISRDRLAFVALRGVAFGSFSAWIVTFLEPVK